MAERKKLSLGQVGARAEERPAAEATKAWTISPKRAEELKNYARDMRRNPSEAHRVLWERLKDKQLGFGFNQQVVMGSAIVDFACKPRWLVVEIGGESEVDGTLAALSDRKLGDVGVRVLRFPEAQVLGETENVVEAIRAELQQPFERPRIKAPRA